MPRRRTAQEAEEEFEDTVIQTLERQIDKRLDGLIDIIKELAGEVKDLAGEVKELKHSISSLTTNIADLVSVTKAQNETAKMQAENVSHLLRMLEQTMPKQAALGGQS